MADESYNPLDYDAQLALDLSPSSFSPEECKWYQRLSEKLGCPFRDAVIYHMGIQLATLRGPLTREEELTGIILKESPQNKEVLLGITKKVFAGEIYPDF